MHYAHHVCKTEYIPYIPAKNVLLGTIIVDNFILRIHYHSLTKKFFMIS